MKERMRSWARDRLLWQVVKNSGYLFSSNSAAIVLSMLQGIFAARLLGVEGYGILAATVIPFVSNVNRLLSFRMSELVVKYLSEFLGSEERMKAAAVVKAAALTEAGASLAAYCLLLLIAPLAARYLVKDAQTAFLFTLYGLVLLSNLLYETALGVIQAARRFNHLAQINLAQSVVTAGMIFAAYLYHGGLLHVLLAYLIGKTLAAVILYGLAAQQMNLWLGAQWWRIPLNRAPNWKELFRFALSTNLNGTVNLIVRDSETLLISALRSPVEAGYYKIAQGVINLVMMPMDPFISTTYAEIARLVAQREWAKTRQLLKRISAIAVAWTLAAGGGLALTGYWLIPFLYGLEFRPGYWAALILLVGYGFANVVNWNRPLLLALGKPMFPLKVSAVVGFVKTLLTLIVVPVMGYLAEAAILSAYFLVSIGIIVRRGWREVRPARDASVVGASTGGISSEGGSA